MGEKKKIKERVDQRRRKRGKESAARLLLLSSASKKKKGKEETTNGGGGGRGEGGVGRALFSMKLAKKKGGGFGQSLRSEEESQGKEGGAFHPFLRLSKNRGAEDRGRKRRGDREKPEFDFGVGPLRGRRGEKKGICDSRKKEGNESFPSILAGRQGEGRNWIPRCGGGEE